MIDGKGPDVIYDPVGGDYAEPAFRRLPGEAATWQWFHVRLTVAAHEFVLLKGASVVGVFWGDFAKREPKANQAMMMELAQWYGQGKIKPVIDHTMPMADLKVAYARMGSRHVKGKLVMVN